MKKTSKENYQPKNPVLKKYIDDDEALSANVMVDSVLISLQDVDIVLERALEQKEREIEKKSKIIGTLRHSSESWERVARKCEEESQSKDKALKQMAEALDKIKYTAVFQKLNYESDRRAIIREAADQALSTYKELIKE